MDLEVFSYSEPVAFGNLNEAFVVEVPGQLGVAHWPFRLLPSNSVAGASVFRERGLDGVQNAVLCCASGTLVGYVSIAFAVMIYSTMPLAGALVFLVGIASSLLALAALRRMWVRIGSRRTIVVCDNYIQIVISDIETEKVQVGDAKLVVARLVGKVFGKRKRAWGCFLIVGQQAVLAAAHVDKRVVAEYLEARKFLGTEQVRPAVVRGKAVLW